MKALEQIGHWYFLSSLCVSLCLANALELLKAFAHTWHCTPSLAAPDLAGRPFPRLSTGAAGAAMVVSRAAPDACPPAADAAPDADIAGGAGCAGWRCPSF